MDTRGPVWSRKIKQVERFHYPLAMMRADMKCYWRFRRNGGYEKIQAEDLLK